MPLPSFSQAMDEMREVPRRIAGAVVAVGAGVFVAVGVNVRVAV